MELSKEDIERRKKILEIWKDSGLLDELAGRKTDITLSLVKLQEDSKIGIMKENDIKVFETLQFPLLRQYSTKRFDE